MPESRWRSIVSSGILSVVLLSLPLGQLWVFLPIFLLAWRVGKREALAAVGVAWGVSVLLMVTLGFGGLGGDLVASRVIELVLFSVLGFAFGGALLRGRSLTRSAAYAVVPWVVLVGGVLASALATDPVQVQTGWQQNVIAPADEMLGGLEKDRIDEEVRDQLTEVRSRLKEYSSWILYLLPASAGLGLMLILWSNILIVKILEPGFAQLEPLRSWRPPDVWFWGMVAALAATLSGVTPVIAVGLNVLLLGAGVYVLSGLSVAAYAAARWRIGGLATIGLAALIFFAGGIYLLGVLGVLDFWLDFRQRWRRADDERREPFDDV